MRNALLLLLLAVIISACGKNETVEPVETDQGVKISFVKDKKLSSGEVVEEPFQANIILIWKSDGKDFKYNGFNDGVYAYDNISKKSYENDYDYLNFSSKIIELPAGKYFITVATDDRVNPKLAYTYTSFTVEKGKYLELKKNVTSMENYKYTAW